MSQSYHIRIRDDAAVEDIFRAANAICPGGDVRRCGDTVEVRMHDRLNGKVALEAGGKVIYQVVPGGNYGRIDDLNKSLHVAGLVSGSFDELNGNYVGNLTGSDYLHNSQTKHKERAVC